MSEELIQLARECGGRVSAIGVWEGDEVFQRPIVTLDAAQLSTFASRIREKALEEAAVICRDERVDDLATDHAEDRAYNSAIAHCTSAIREAKSLDSRFICDAKKEKP